ncbi:hypothetical protein BCR36DRAFT_583163, partial [Piromyces finnis]
MKFSKVVLLLTASALSLAQDAISGTKVPPSEALAANASLPPKALPVSTLPPKALPTAAPVDQIPAPVPAPGTEVPAEQIPSFGTENQTTGDAAENSEADNADIEGANQFDGAAENSEDDTAAIDGVNQLDAADNASDDEGNVPADNINGNSIEDYDANVDDNANPADDAAENSDDDSDVAKTAGIGGGAAAAVAAAAGIFFYTRKSKRQGLQSVRTQETL